MSLYPYGVQGNPGYPLGISLSDSPLPITATYTPFVRAAIADSGVRLLLVADPSGLVLTESGELLALPPASETRARLAGSGARNAELKDSQRRALPWQSV